MRIGQTSLIVFFSKVIASALGFVATVYFARVLGTEVLGIYSGIIALTSWLQLASGPGVGVAIRKRVSEGSEPEAYISAGAILFGGSFLLVALMLILFQGVVESYIDGFSQYSSVSVVWFVIGVLLSVVISAYISAVLQGGHRVHIAGFLEPTRTSLQSVTQVALVVIGFNVVGMVTGYMMGSIIASMVGLFFIRIRPKMPGLDHFHSVLLYAKYSWLDGVKSRVFSSLDILILTAFVPSSLVGIYSAAWSLSAFVTLFGHAISQAVFPKISEATNNKKTGEVERIVEDAIAFSGLIAIPGFVGGIILDERILRIYGSEFSDGTAVLWLLLLTVLLFTYMRQFLNALNAINHPDLAFKVNILFVSANVILNIYLIITLGWVGAAIASAASTGISLVFSYIFLRKSISIDLPIIEIMIQALAAMSMGVLVLVLIWVLEAVNVNLPNSISVLIIVIFGAVVYNIILLLLSSRFRQVIKNNIPYSYKKYI